MLFWRPGFALEQGSLPEHLPGVEAGAQQADDDEGPGMGGHGAHDEVQVALGDVVAVFLFQHRQGLVFGLVAALVGDESGLDLPVIKGDGVRSCNPTSMSQQA